MVFEIGLLSYLVWVCVLVKSWVSLVLLSGLVVLNFVFCVLVILNLF